MNKVLLTVSIMVVFIGSLLAQESPTTPRAAHVQISQGPEIAVASGYLTVIRWTVNNPGGSPVHHGVALWDGSQEPESNRQKSDQVKPIPFIDSFPRTPVRPPAEDDLLLQG